MSAEDSASRAETALEDETRVLARLRAGEAQAYEELVCAYAGRLMAVAQHILENEADAADAVQDAFLAPFQVA